MGFTDLKMIYRPNNNVKSCAVCEECIGCIAQSGRVPAHQESRHQRTTSTPQYSAIAGGQILSAGVVGPAQPELRPLLWGSNEAGTFPYNRGMSLKQLVEPRVDLLVLPNVAQFCLLTWMKTCGMQTSASTICVPSALGYNPPAPAAAELSLEHQRS